MQQVESVAIIPIDMCPPTGPISTPAPWVKGLRCYSPRSVPLRMLAAVAGQRWRIEESGGYQARRAIRMAMGGLHSQHGRDVAIGPPMGGAAIGVFGSASTVLANAVNFLLSAAGIAANGGDEPHPAARASAQRRRGRDLLAGWHLITSHASLRPLFAAPFWSTASSCRPRRC